MDTIKIEWEIPTPTAWEISALAKLSNGEVVAPDGLYDGYSAQKAAYISRLHGWGAITHSWPGENGKMYYVITELGK